MESVKSNIYFWQSIPEKNVKTLRQSFSSGEKESEEAKKKSERNPITSLGHKGNDSFKYPRMCYE